MTLRKGIGTALAALAMLGGVAVASPASAATRPPAAPKAVAATTYTWSSWVDVFYKYPSGYIDGYITELRWRIANNGSSRRIDTIQMKYGNFSNGQELPTFEHYTASETNSQGVWGETVSWYSPSPVSGMTYYPQAIEMSNVPDNQAATFNVHLAEYAPYSADQVIYSHSF